MDSNNRGTKKDVVRLQPEDRAKHPAPPPSIPVVRKLVIRLLPGINEHLRAEMRYRGDLSTMIVEAINAVDLESVRLVELASETRLHTTTIGLPESMHTDLKALSKTRTASMNVLVNTALAHWLAGKGKIRLI